MPDAADQRTSLAIPIFSKIDTDITTADAELWWPRFVLYMDLTQEIDVTGYHKRYKNPINRERDKTEKTKDMGNQTKSNTRHDKETTQ